MRGIARKILKGLQVCQSCGNKIFLQGYSDHRLTRLMQTNKICYECAYWKDIIEFPPTHLEIINGKCYRIYPEVEEKDPSILLGGKGKMRYFMREDMKPFKSNDVWLIGVIPQRFLPQFPPTAFEIDKRVYNLISNNTRRCQAVGCMDRYLCIRYRLEFEDYGKNPFNKVPNNWKAGDEHCKFFINRQSIKTDDSNVTKNPNPNGRKITTGS